MLLDKPSRRIQPVTVEYIGFTIPDAFVVGYGLDYAERYRNLRDVCVLDPTAIGAGKRLGKPLRRRSGGHAGAASPTGTQRPAAG